LSSMASMAMTVTIRRGHKIIKIILIIKYKKSHDCIILYYTMSCHIIIIKIKCLIKYIFLCKNYISCVFSFNCCYTLLWFKSSNCQIL